MRKLWITAPPAAAAAVLPAIIPTTHGKAAIAEASASAGVNIGPAPAGFSGRAR